jgi:transposase
MLYTGIAWEFLPQVLGFGSGMTCWRRAARLDQAGGWANLRQVLLAELYTAGKLDWSKAVIGSSHIRALKGGPKPVRARLIEASRAPSTM